MLIFGITVIIAIAVVAVALAYHYKWEAQFQLDQLNELSEQYIKMVDVTHDQTIDLVNENNQLRTDLGQYIAAAMFDAWTIRNMTTSIVALSDQLDEFTVAHAKVVLGAKDVKK